MDDETLFQEFSEWIATLPAEFAFLLALPFVVGLAGVLQYGASVYRGKREADKARRAREAETRDTKHRPHAPPHRWQRTH